MRKRRDIFLHGSNRLDPAGLPDLSFAFLLSLLPSFLPASASTLCSPSLPATVNYVAPWMPEDWVTPSVFHVIQPNCLKLLYVPGFLFSGSFGMVQSRLCQGPVALIYFKTCTPLFHLIVRRAAQLISSVRCAEQHAPSPLSQQCCYYNLIISRGKSPSFASDANKQEGWSAGPIQLFESGLPKTDCAQYGPSFSYSTQAV